jgi:hypothetical protein
LDTFDCSERRRSERIPRRRRLWPIGRAWRQTDVENTDLETVILDMLEGQYKNPVRVVAFNIAEKWSQDVSADVAYELRQRCDLDACDVLFFLQDFVDQKGGTATSSCLCRCGWHEKTARDRYCPKGIRAVGTIR